MIWLLANWKPIASALATAVIGWMLHSLDVNRIEAAQREAIAQQIAYDNEQCANDKAITEGVSRDYQKNIIDLADQLSRLKRVRPARCVVPSTDTARRGDATPSGTVDARQDGGVTSDALYDFAGDGEGYRLQVKACQQFINEVWEK